MTLVVLAGVLKASAHPDHWMIGNQIWIHCSFIDKLGLFLSNQEKLTISTCSSVLRNTVTTASSDKYFFSSILTNQLSRMFQEIKNTSYNPTIFNPSRQNSKGVVEIISDIREFIETFESFGIKNTMKMVQIEGLCGDYILEATREGIKYEITVMRPGLEIEQCYSIGYQFKLHDIESHRSQILFLYCMKSELDQDSGISILHAAEDQKNYLYPAIDINCFLLPNTLKNYLFPSPA